MCKNQAMGWSGHDGRHRVAVLVRHGVMPMELGLVHQIFGAAAGSDGAPLYDVVTCASSPGPVRTDADFAIDVSHGLDVLADADTVVVPASHEQDDTDHTDGTADADGSAGLTPELAGAFARLRPGARVASICTGAFVLAAAGLLDGRRATTHWQSAERFRRRFPAVDLDPDVLYVDEGDVLTSAGEAAGIDLCLHLVRRDHGAAVANAVARRTVVPPHREGGQAQYIRLPVPDTRQSSTGRARAWALAHLDQALTLQEMAACESMSVRTFTRRFREEVGDSPLQWLSARRLDRARELLEDSDLPVEAVAARSGFGTAASLRQHLHTVLGLSPSAYRTTFRGER